MQGGRPDGRLCDLCGCKDTDPDPVDKDLVISVSDELAVVMSWGYPADPLGNQSGLLFW